MKKKPALTETHKINRRECIRKWFEDSVEWSKVVISDEKRWCLDGPDGILHYWHQLGSEHQYLSRRNFRGGSVSNVLGRNFIRKEFDLVWIDGNLNAEEYQKILKCHFMPHMNQDYIFQQDGTPAHTLQHQH